MSNLQSDVEALRREAAELRAARQNHRSEARPEEAVRDAEKPDWEKQLEELTELLEEAPKELERAVREFPALALLAALTTGIVIGQLLSRR